MPEVVAYIGLGANLGNAHATLVAALEAVSVLPQTRRLSVSALYQTAPVDATGPDFLNAVVSVMTALPPRRLLDELHTIERRYGRVRMGRNAPRTLDLDLLLHEAQPISQDPMLLLPHPRMHERAFVLCPLADVAPNLVIPGQGRVCHLLQGLSGQALQRLAVDWTDKG